MKSNPPINLMLKDEIEKNKLIKKNIKKNLSQPKLTCYTHNLGNETGITPLKAN